MTLGRFFCRPINEPSAELRGTEARHLASVLRARLGNRVELFDGAGALAQAKITAIKKNKVTLAIEELQVKTPPTRARIIIACSLAKGERFDGLISKCTELGVDRITPVRFARTVKLVQGSKAIERYEKLAISTAKQCKRLFLPQIDSPLPLREALNILKKSYPDARMLLGSLNPDATNILHVPAADTDELAWVGPEGGLTVTEQNLLRAQGAQEVRLTDTILRIETAAVAFAALLTIRRECLKK